MDVASFQGDAVEGEPNDRVGDAIQFEFDSAQPTDGEIERWYNGLTDEQRAALADANNVIEVTGSASRAGSPEHNQRLSEGRADAVADWLANHGTKGWVTTTGRGETDAARAGKPDGSDDPRDRTVSVEVHRGAAGDPTGQASDSSHPPIGQATDSSRPPSGQPTEAGRLRGDPSSAAANRGADAPGGAAGVPRNDGGAAVVRPEGGATRPPPEAAPPVDGPLRAIGVRLPGGDRAGATGGRGEAGDRQRVLIVGAERPDEFAYANRLRAAGHDVTVSNPKATPESREFQRSGGNFFNGPVRDLPPGRFDLIREDFPHPALVHPAAGEFVHERTSRLAPGGTYVIATENHELVDRVRGYAGHDAGMRVRTVNVPFEHHDATPRMSPVYGSYAAERIIIVEAPKTPPATHGPSTSPEGTPGGRTSPDAPGTGGRPATDVPRVRGADRLPSTGPHAPPETARGPGVRPTAPELPPGRLPPPDAPGTPRPATPPEATAAPRPATRVTPQADAPVTPRVTLRGVAGTVGVVGLGIAAGLLEGWVRDRVINNQISKDLDRIPAQIAERVGTLGDQATALRAQNPNAQLYAHVTVEVSVMSVMQSSFDGFMESFAVLPASGSAHLGSVTLSTESIATPRQSQDSDSGFGWSNDTTRTTYSIPVDVN